MSLRASEQASALWIEIQQQRTLITTRSSEVDSLMFAFRAKLSPEETSRLAVAKAELNSVVATIAMDPLDVKTKLWKNTSTVRIAFLDGPAELRARVAEIAKDWLRERASNSNLPIMMPGADPHEL